MLNTAEIIVILATIAVVMGVGRLPQIGEAIGKARRNYKRALGGQADIDITPGASGGSATLPSPTPNAQEIEDAEIID